MEENSHDGGKKIGKDLKIIIVGDVSTGKTSIIRRYIDEVFEEKKIASIGPQFSSKIIKLNGVIYRIQFWDLPGQDRTPELTGIFCRDSNGVIFCCDISKIETKENIKKWYESIKGFNDIENIPKIILENKCDLLKEESHVNDNLDSLKNISDELGCQNYFRTSALNGYNIKESFDYLINEIIKLTDTAEVQLYNSFSIDQDKHQENNKKNRCC